jgi:hypothetical protein
MESDINLDSVRNVLEKGEFEHPQSPRPLLKINHPEPKKF